MSTKNKPSALEAAAAVADAALAAAPEVVAEVEVTAPEVVAEVEVTVDAEPYTGPFIEHTFQVEDNTDGSAEVPEVIVTETEKDLGNGIKLVSYE